MNVRTFFVGALLVAGVIPLTVHVVPLRANEHAEPRERVTYPEWPTHFRDRPLTQLPLGALEERFAKRFPGAIARFTDGERVFVLREVTRPTRMLHPAADCFRGIGHRIGVARLEHDARGRLWRCFESTAPDGQALRVCERIQGSDGSSFVDASAWFWAAAAGRSLGPWRAVTMVEEGS
jgi:hypothetical protein